VPGLDRSLVASTRNSVMDFVLSMQTCEGIRELVQAERAFALVHGMGACLTYSRSDCLMSLIRVSDVTTAIKGWGSPTLSRICTRYRLFSSGPRATAGTHSPESGGGALDRAHRWPVSARIFRPPA
jgi:hypothetical protein